MLHHLLLLTTLKEDHENDKIVIKVPEVHHEENNYNFCHIRFLMDVTNALRVSIFIHLLYASYTLQILDLRFEIEDLRFEI